MKQKDEYFKKLALQYVELDGRKLKEEQSQLEKEDKNSKKMDHDVGRRIKVLKRKKNIRWVGAMAACCMVFLFSYPYLKQRNQVDKGELAQSESNQIISLNAVLPSDYTITDVEQDKGETLYYIEHTNKENVVISISKSTGPIKTDGLDGMSVGNKTVYGRKEKDYSILKFEKDGNVFVLTCKSDLGSLLELSEHIFS